MGSVYQPLLKNGERQATYKISYSVNGKKIIESTGVTDEREARRILKEREGRVATGQPILPRVDRIRYEEARADLVEHYKTTEDRDLAEAEARLKHLDRFFANCKLVAIAPDVVTRYASLRKDEGAANGTINRELATLSKLLHLAVEHGKLLRTFVVKKLREADPRAGFVTREQFDAIAGKLTLELQVAAFVGYILGWRKREVLDLPRRNLDLSAGTLRLDPGTTKNREGRVAYLTPELHAALVAQVERVKALEKKIGRIIPWLFPHLDGPHAGSPILDPRKAWALACSQAGLPGVLIHDLRRSAVRNMEKASVPRSVAMKITGHKTEAVYRRYAIVNDADLQAAAASVARVVAR
jgi:integrase